MRAIWLWALLCVALIPLRAPAQSQDSDLRAQIQEIKQQLAQMDELKARLAELEKRLDESEKQKVALQKAQEGPSPAPGTPAPAPKIRIDGRIFAGILASGDQGTYPNWSTDTPDARLRFTFTPWERVTVVTRLSIAGATPGDFDYLYLDYAGLLSPTNSIRIGQRKVDVGQETWTDNPVENMLVTNSVSHVSGYAIGVALLGKFHDAPTSPLYEAGFVNGARGVRMRPNNSLPYNLKIGTPLPNNLFASASYFNSGRLSAEDSSAISVAELAGAPSGAAQWRRGLWELDLRYNSGAGGIRPVIPWGDLPKTMLGAAYGRFDDSAVGTPDRNGSYWFVEGLLRLSPRLYTAARYSTVGLDDGVLAPLGRSPVGVNKYSRTALGFGYKLSDLTLLKTEYAFNHTAGGTSRPSLSQFALGVASKF